MVYVETDAVVTVARLTCSVLHCKPDSSIITFTTMLFSETKAAITQILFGLVSSQGCMPQRAGLLDRDSVQLSKREDDLKT